MKMDNPDLEDYWKEYHLFPSLQTEDENVLKHEEGCDELEWLIDLGNPQLVEPFQEGREIPKDLVETLMTNHEFTPDQAEAIRRRVRTVNKTVRQRQNRAKNRKADVRDVFKDVEIVGNSSCNNTGSDSIDSGVYTTTITLDESQQQRRRLLARAPSVPISHELFTKFVPDVAGGDGIPLVRYQYFGTVRHRSGSDPLFLDEASGLSEGSLVNSSRLSRSHGSLLDITDQFRRPSLVSETDRTWIESLDRTDVEQLKILLFTEVTSIFDQFRINIPKGKHLRSKKPEGNVFGVPLATLIEKDDRAFKSEPGNKSQVPLIIRMLVNHLERNHLHEEGLLRVPGVKTRIEMLTSQIESQFYTEQTKIEQQLFAASPHDVAAVLKKLLRELPDPLLTLKLLQKFYAVGIINRPEMQEYVLNLLVLQLPREHQFTLRYLFKFFHKIIEVQESNKMGIHGVATIIAPSLLPPRLLTNTKNDISSQVLIAENCISLSEKLLAAEESLWLVPRKLIHQLRNRNQKENNKPSLFWKSKYSSSNRSAIDFIHVEAPQLNLPCFRVNISDSLTAGEVVLLMIKEGKMKYEGSKVVDKQYARVRKGKELEAKLATSDGLAWRCILSSATHECSLNSHFLYEYGGNIVQRELEHSAVVSAVLHDNPSAQWRLECRHRTASKDIPIKSS